MRITQAALCGLVLLLSAGPVRAELFTFGYSASAPSVTNGAAPFPASIGFFGGGTGSGPGTATGILNWNIFVSPMQDPSTLTPFVKVPLVLTIGLADDAAQKVPGGLGSGTLTFNGTFSGAIPAHSNPTWTFAWATLQQSITLGAPGPLHTYTVTAPAPDAYHDVDQHGPEIAFTIHAHAYEPGVDPAPLATPEPASLALAFLGLPAVLLAGRRQFARMINSRGTETQRKAKAIDASGTAPCGIRPGKSIET